jgi:hypothetical protein
VSKHPWIFHQHSTDLPGKVHYPERGEAEGRLPTSMSIPWGGPSIGVTPFMDGLQWKIMGECRKWRFIC